MRSHPYAGRGLSGEPQRDGSAGAQGLQDGRRPAGAGRSRGADHSGAVRAAGAGALRRRRDQGGDHPLLRLRRGERRDRAGAAARGAGDRRALRHGGERTERRRLRQHRGGAVPDLQSRDGRRRRAAAAAGGAHARPGRGDLAERRHGLRVLRSRPAEGTVVPLHRDHRQRGLPRGGRLRRVHRRREPHRRDPDADRGHQERRDLRARRRQGAARRRCR